MDTFARQLSDVMAEIRAAERRGVFMKVPIEKSAVIAAAASHGFQFHHAEGTSAMLLNWLPGTQGTSLPRSFYPSYHPTRLYGTSTFLPILPPYPKLYSLLTATGRYCCVPEDTPCPVPDFATHVIGLGGMCLNEQDGTVLCVKEKRAPAATSQGSWKVRRRPVSIRQPLGSSIPAALPACLACSHPEVGVSTPRSAAARRPH